MRLRRCINCGAIIPNSNICENHQRACLSRSHEKRIKKLRRWGNLPLFRRILFEQRYQNLKSDSRQKTKPKKL